MRNPDAVNDDDEDVVANLTADEAAMTGVSTPPRKYNFDPTNYVTPEYKKKNGEYQLTDYQAAITVRNWMHANMPGRMINREMLSELAKLEKSGSGAHTVNGKTYNFTEQEKAAFRKFDDNGATLFRRLDSGENGTHDFQMGEWDIDAAIRNGRLHGAAQHSEEGYWRNRNKDMPPAQAAEVLDDYLTGKLGDGWTVKENDLRLVGNSHGMYVNTNNGREFVMIDDPEVIRAAGVALDNWSKLQVGEGNSVGILSQAELNKLLAV